MGLGFRVMGLGLELGLGFVRGRVEYNYIYRGVHELGLVVQYRTIRKLRVGMFHK